MIQKFIANGEDITDLFYWETDLDVRRGGGGPASVLSLFPFADKAKRVEEHFCQLGTFVVEFFGTAGRVAYHVQFLNSDLDTKKQNGQDVALLRLKVLSRA